MPHFTKQGHRYFVTYITGPSHVRLGLAFGASDGEPAMIQRPPVAACDHGRLDEESIRAAVRDGLADARDRAGVTVRATEIVYVADDSPRYDIYRHCAFLLAERVGRGGEFLENEKNA
jgi:hypothetical protein